jgi:uncharacterized transporter YbjL
MTRFVTTLRQNPDLAIFLTLGIGAWLGNLKLASFSLGSATGALLAGVLIGQLEIAVPSTTKQVLFLLFLFANGLCRRPPLPEGCAGAQTTTPALAAVQEAAGSKVPVLGYTVPYTTGQILLTFWGSLIVVILA